MNQSESAAAASRKGAVSSRAYATVISTDDYVPAVLQVARRLRECNSAYPFVVFASRSVSDVAKAQIGSCGVEVIQLTGAIELPPSLVEANAEDGMAHWSHTFDKLQLFDQVRFEKIVYLDSDIYILRNLDDLFDRPAMSAVASGQTLRSDWRDLNSGVLVIEPESGMTARLVANIDRTFERLRAAGVNRFGDQDVIHTSFPSWPDDAALHLGEEFNMFFADLEPCLRDHRFTLDGDARSGATPVRVVHFAGPRKPWHLRYWLGDFLKAVNPVRPRPGSAVVLLRFAVAYLGARREIRN